MLKQPLIVTINGKDFIDGEDFKCFYSPLNSTSEYIEADYYNNLVTAIYLNST